MTHMRYFPVSRLPIQALCPAACLTPLLLGFALLLASCTTRTPTAPTPPPGPTLPALPPGPLPVGSLPGFGSDPLDDLRTALAQQCAMNRPPAQWPELCSSLPQAAVTTSAPLRQWLADRFVAQELIDGQAPEGLVTG